MSASTGRPRKDGVRGEGPQGEAGTKVLHHRLTGKGRSHCLCLLSRQGLWGHKLVRPGANSTAGYERRTLPCQAWAPALLVAPHRPAQACPVHATTDSRKTAGQGSRMPAGPPTANGFKQTPGGASGGPPAHACPPILSDDPGSPTVLRAVWGQAPLPGARSTGTGASCFRPHYSAGKEEPPFSRRRNGEEGGKESQETLCVVGKLLAQGGWAAGALRPEGRNQQSWEGTVLPWAPALTASGLRSTRNLPTADTPVPAPDLLELSDWLSSVRCPIGQSAEGQPPGHRSNLWLPSPRVRCPPSSNPRPPLA